MDNQTERKEMYFVLTGNKHPIIADIKALRLLNNIHSSNRINNLFLRYNESFSIIERYCRENRYGAIEISKIFSNSEIFPSIIGEFPESKRFAYITNTETENSLERLRESLENRDFNLKIILSS